MKKIILINRDNNQKISGRITKQYTDSFGIQITVIKTIGNNIINLYGTCEVGAHFSNLSVFLIEEEAKQSIIGKMYQVNDNSYGINITAATGYKKNIRANLCHCYFRQEASAIGKIISEPFLCKVIWFTKLVEHTMILIEFENNTYTVLYNEDWVIN